MQIIRPGKIKLRLKDAPIVGKKPAQHSPSDPSKQRFVWDDYSPQKNTKKKEYEMGSGNRMIPKSQPQKDDKREGEGGIPEGDDTRVERHQPRGDYEVIEEKLGFEFQDRSLLSRALTHRSALGIKERADYERLEFLGDAVLDLSVAHLLSDLHPDAREGELSKMRAALVNTQALAQVAKGLELGPFIRLGRGELSSGGFERPSILADVMEAVIGAVYRDSSYEKALQLIERIFGETLKQVTPFDPKTELQEVLHAAGSEPPTYLLELVEGPEHAPTFVTVVVIDAEIAGRGRGPTKKAAQQLAAAEALERMQADAQPIEMPNGQSYFIPELFLVKRANDMSGATPGLFFQDDSGMDSADSSQD